MATATTTSSASPSAGIRFCASCLAVYRQDFRRCPLDGASLVVGANDPWVGLTVGTHYVIEAFIGEGAMGRVYRAHHAQFSDRRYAIKLLLGDLAASSQMRARFVLEAEHASRLLHPNVVGVTDFGANDRGGHFMAMDLVEGQTIGALLRQGPMEADRVITLARQICLGLEYAHDRGMIHRDLKPDNILVLREGTHELARIADFGLALSKNDETRLTTTGVVCTPAYAAPEQLRGQAIDQRVDLYALGATMYEMLSGGVLPFPGDVDASVTAKLQGEAPSIHLVAPRVPPALVGLVGRLLSSRPEQRPRSARAVIRALDQALKAPRVVIQIDQTTPLRVHADVEQKDAADVRTSGVAGELASPARRRRWRRAAVQLGACTTTLLAVLVWTDADEAAPGQTASLTAPATGLPPIAAVEPAVPAAILAPYDEDAVAALLAAPWPAADTPVAIPFPPPNAASAGADAALVADASAAHVQSSVTAPVIEKRVRRAPVRRRATGARRPKRVVPARVGDEVVNALRAAAGSANEPALGVSGAAPAAAEASDSSSTSDAAGAGSATPPATDAAPTTNAPPADGLPATPPAASPPPPPATPEEPAPPAARPSPGPDAPKPSSNDALMPIDL